MRPIKLRTETLTILNVFHDRTTGSPTGRESYGDGDPIVADGVTTIQGAGESQPQGEGGQDFLLEEERKVCECKQPNRFSKLYVSSVNNKLH
jgi:hypothetical protein